MRNKTPYKAVNLDPIQIRMHDCGVRISLIFGTFKICKNLISLGVMNEKSYKVSSKVGFLRVNLVSLIAMKGL